MLTVSSAFRQELGIPLALSQDWQVALFSMYCMHLFGNELLKSPNDYHCQVGHTNEHEPPACVARPDSTNGFVHLSPFIWRNPSLQANAYGIFELTLSSFKFQVY